MPPVWVIAERLGAHDIPQAELARRCVRSAKPISEIISWKAPSNPQPLFNTGRSFGVDVSVWLGIEAEHRLRHAPKRSQGEAGVHGPLSDAKGGATK